MPKSLTSILKWTLKTTCSMGNYDQLEDLVEALPVLKGDLDKAIKLILSNEILTHLGSIINERLVDGCVNARVLHFTYPNGYIGLYRISFHNKDGTSVAYVGEGELVKLLGEIGVTDADIVHMKLSNAFKSFIIKHSENQM